MRTGTPHRRAAGGCRVAGGQVCRLRRRACAISRGRDRLAGRCPAAGHGQAARHERRRHRGGDPRPAGQAAGEQGRGRHGERAALWLRRGWRRHPGDEPGPARGRAQRHGDPALRRQPPARGAAAALLAGQGRRDRPGVVHQRHPGGHGGAEDRLHPVGAGCHAAVPYGPPSRAQERRQRAAADLQARCGGAFRHERQRHPHDHQAGRRLDLLPAVQPRQRWGGRQSALRGRLSGQLLLGARAAEGKLAAHLPALRAAGAQGGPGRQRQDLLQARRR